VKQYFSGSAFIGNRMNRLVSAFLIAYLVLSTIKIFLSGGITWSLYGLSVLALILGPWLFLGDRERVVPFESLLLVAIPFTVKGLELGFVGSHTLNYISASAIALLVVTELDTYTSFKTTYRFSIALVTLSTLAVAGFWAVGRWLSDIYLGTSFITSEHALMWEFVAAGIAGLVSSQLFTFYFRKRDKQVAAE